MSPLGLILVAVAIVAVVWEAHLDTTRMLREHKERRWHQR